MPEKADENATEARGAKVERLDRLKGQPEARAEIRAARKAA
jgi:hypothetical protein